jgi:hypothetical protein
VCIGAPVRPGASFGTTNAESPLVPGAEPVRANTTYRLATGAFEMKCFSPVSAQ